MVLPGGEAERTHLTRHVLGAIEQRVREAVALGKAGDIRILVRAYPNLGANALSRITRLLPDPSFDRAPVTEDEAYLPRFSQGDFNTCGAASLLTAMLAFDRALSDKSRINRHVLSVCSVILRNLSGLPPQRRSRILAVVLPIQVRAATPSGSSPFPSEADYRALAMLLYNITRARRAPDQRLLPGLLASEIESIVAQLDADLNGQASHRPATERPIAGFDPSFSDFVGTSSLATGLQPGAAVQVSWYVRRGREIFPHAVLLGRVPSGRLWYYNDQGFSPAFRRTAGLLSVLLGRVTSSSSYWLLTTERLSQIREAFTHPGVIAARIAWEDPTIIAIPR